MTDNVTVLHVDDEEAFIDLLGTYLEDILQADLAMVATTDPVEGLDLVETREVDCVVCDYDMPEIDGLEFLSKVRETRPDLPFVLVTGKGNERVASEAIRLNVTDYLTKPSGSQEYKTLANRLHVHVASYRRHRDTRTTADRIGGVVGRITEPVIGVNTALECTYLNPAAQQLVDGSEAEFLGTSVQAVLVSMASRRW